MVQFQGNFTQLTDIDPILTDIFYQEYTRELGSGGVMALFRVGRSQKAKETDLKVGSFKDPVLFTGKVQYTDAKANYEVEYDFDEWVNGFQITRQMRDDMQYEGIFASASEMGTSFARKRRKDAASVFNNATSASFVGYDVKALAANDHPRSKAD